MKIASLFSGVGGLELGLGRAGHETILLNEIDRAAASVLAERFPDVEIHSDVVALDHLPRNADLVTAGFPCQDLSQAGRMNGINGSKSGLVGNLFRLLESRRVDNILIENVPFMLHLHRGAAMDFIVKHLEALGYSWAYRTIDTRSFGLPQRRRRVFLLASRDFEPGRVLFLDQSESVETSYSPELACGFYWTEGNTGLGWAIDSIPTLKGGSSLGIPSAPAIWMPDGSIGTPDIRDAERLQGFPSNWTKPAEEVCSPRHRWRLVGNAVTTKVAEWLGRILSAVERGTPASSNKAWPVSGWPSAAYGSPRGARSLVVSSEWPVYNRCEHLTAFLHYPLTPLSYRAAEGFRSRLARSSLHHDAEFMRDLERHCGESKPAPKREAV
jgi:DNA (cytosine-5)-methyltransferase 1